MLATLIGASLLSFKCILLADVVVDQITKADRALTGLPYSYFYYVPDGICLGDPTTLIHVATSSPPIDTIDECDDWTRGQLANYVESGLADASGLIMFSVSVPQYVRGNDRSGCAQVLQRDNFLLSNVDPLFHRPDLKVILVVEHLAGLLAQAGYAVDGRFFVTGTSNGGVWAHRFALLHPDYVKAVAAGSHGLWTMPVEQHSGSNTPYQLGIQSLDALGLDTFDVARVREIPFLVFIGEDDTNDPFIEAPGGTYGYSEEQIVWYTTTFGMTPQQRAEAFHQELLQLGADSTFTSYPGVGHELTEGMKEDIVDFFLEVLAAPPPNSASVFRVDASGNVLADETFHGKTFEVGQADIAESVPITTPVEPGDVVEFDPTAPMQYRIAEHACSSLVAGVISTTPGVTLGGSLVASEKALLALTGIVPVKVTDEGGPIQPGDLLVTSSTPGHAMRWPGLDLCLCSLVGKALEPMSDERGVILVLLTAH